MNVIVNGKKCVTDNTLNYEDVVDLAGLKQRDDYTVAYRWRYKNRVTSGTLGPLDWMPVEDGMVFNVAHTGNA